MGLFGNIDNKDEVFKVQIIFNGRQGGELETDIWSCGHFLFLYLNKKITKESRNIKNQNRRSNKKIKTSLYMRESRLPRKKGIVNLHSTRETHGVTYLSA